MTTYLALAAGLLLAAGIGMVVAGLTPQRPDLAAAVHLLLPDPDAPTISPADPQAGLHGWVARVLLPRAADRLRLARFAADLRMLDRSVEHLAAQKLGYGMLGLVFPTVLTGLLAAAGIRAPAAVPLAVGLVVAGVLFWVPDLMVRRDAAAARAAMRAATGAYIDLVALERLADAGTTEALDRAAAVGQSPEFARLRDALLRAQLAGRPAWAGLSDLAGRTGVVELGDLADIMAVAGHDGAAVYATLRARAASLRTQLLTEQVAVANAASEHMVIPVSLLGLCFMALVAYPAFVRIMLG
ncbi:type II secretion system F family protein [Actinotalea ferrariae]|uniref:type II secretion system F family protein n=1 Tax=Actinotalea ferrariae TaxID=1386098 RepID=UPI001C8C6043|nr:type II secretion system F family protein [Actinotalea ferrariae]MBX9243807.1 type II secretion system F family protein [Actinotalea ferrariae]